MLWDTIDASIMYILTTSGTVARYTVGWVTNGNSVMGSDHEIAVIDGSKLWAQLV